MSIDQDHKQLKKDAARFFTGYPAARSRLLDQQRGLPGAGNANGSGSGGHASPVERALELGGTNPDDDKAWTFPVDHAAGVLSQLDQLHHQITRDMAKAAAIVAANTPRLPSAKQRAEVEAGNDPTPECQITRKFIDAHERALCTSNLGGLITEAVPVCRWVYDFARRNGKLPTKTQLAQHHNGRTVLVPAGS